MGNTMMTSTIDDIQRALEQLGIPAWLLYSFRDSNPIANAMIGLRPDAHVTRRWVCLVPAVGRPKTLVHRIEPHLAAQIPGDVQSYSSYDEFTAGLQRMLDGVEAVAMEYSPMNAIPVVSRVDAGIIDVVRSFGTTVVSSGDLVAWLGARLDQEQIASARRAGQCMREVVMDAFAGIARSMRNGADVSELSVQTGIMQAFSQRGIETDHAPIVAVNANSADPHYSPATDTSAIIRAGDFVLIDLWGRERGARSVFGDITWTAYVGDRVPDDIREVFDVVARARDVAFDGVRAAFEQGKSITGADVDRLARSVIDAAGYAQYFVHRTGHSITSELHGAGVNLDGFESHDSRNLSCSTSFSIEPGIYLPGRFGIRSEIDVVIDEHGIVTATSEPRQQSVLPLLAYDA